MDKLKAFFSATGHLFADIGHGIGALLVMILHLVGKDELTKAITFVGTAATTFVANEAQGITQADANTLRREWVVGSLMNAGILDESHARLLTELAVNALKSGADKLIALGESAATSAIQ